MVVSQKLLCPSMRSAMSYFEEPLSPRYSMRPGASRGPTLGGLAVELLAIGLRIGRGTVHDAVSMIGRAIDGEEFHGVHRRY